MGCNQSIPNCLAVSPTIPFSLHDWCQEVSGNGRSAVVPRTGVGAGLHSIGDQQEAQRPGFDDVVLRDFEGNMVSIPVFDIPFVVGGPLGPCVEGGWIAELWVSYQGEPEKVCFVLGFGPWKIPAQARLSVSSSWGALNVVYEYWSTKLRTTSWAVEVSERVRQHMIRLLTDMPHDFDSKTSTGDFVHVDLIAHGRRSQYMWEVSVVKKEPHDGQVWLCLSEEWHAWFPTALSRVRALFLRLALSGCGVLVLSSVPGRTVLTRVQDEFGFSRALDLFAGIGGWQDGVKSAWPVSFVSVEWDKGTALALATSGGVPLIFPDQLDPIVAETDFALCADVFDETWYKVSLVAPFDVGFWSSPCPSWSRAGYAQGLESDEGLKMLQAFRLLALLGVSHNGLAIGENVYGLRNHPHFAVVEGFAQLVGGHTLQVLTHDLAMVAPMKGLRVFLAQSPRKVDAVSFHVDFKTFRSRLGLGLSDGKGRLDTAIPDVALDRLQDLRLLPLEWAKELAGRGKDDIDGNSVLQARVVEDSFPTLLAAYRSQHLLPVDLLLGKGLLTFLVQDTEGQVR